MIVRKLDQQDMEQEAHELAREEAQAQATMYQQGGDDYDVNYEEVYERIYLQEMERLAERNADIEDGDEAE